MKIFEMLRERDIGGEQSGGGHSGTGKVLEGVVFSDGTCVVRWAVAGQPNSTAVWESFDDFAHFHVDKRPENGTTLNWLNENPRD
jgi:hypothetical protein